MQIFERLGLRVRYWYRLYVMRDPFLRTVRQWFHDRGDETLRLDYPLGADSVVIDVGGFQGDFADAISKRFGCHVFIFEPVREFYERCVARFSENPKIRVFDFGLGHLDASLPMQVAGDASSFNRAMPASCAEVGKLRKADSALAELGITHVDLMKINIEGGEYDLLQLLVDSGWIKRIQYLQVQFHNFFPEAAERRGALRGALSRTHEEMWNYDFVWESWRRKTFRNHDDVLI